MPEKNTIVQCASCGHMVPWEGHPREECDQFRRIIDPPESIQPYETPYTNHSEVAQRKDTGKLRYDLLPPEWEEELVKVITAGLKKYPEDNWRNSINKPESAKWRKICTGSLRRHLAARQKGEIVDPELGTQHMAHVAWNALVIMLYDIEEKKT